MLLFKLAFNSAWGLHQHFLFSQERHYQDLVRTLLLHFCISFTPKEHVGKLVWLSDTKDVCNANESK